MSEQLTMPCWEIIQCNNEETCLLAENDKKACWEMVEDADAQLFHICMDCLVFLAKHKDSILTKEECNRILKQRKKNVHLVAHTWNPSQTFMCSAVQTKGNLGEVIFHSA
jgi:hypothetical protein